MRTRSMQRTGMNSPVFPGRTPAARLLTAVGVLVTLLPMAPAVGSDIDFEGSGLVTPAVGPVPEGAFAPERMGGMPPGMAHPAMAYAAPGMNPAGPGMKGPGMNSTPGIVGSGAMGRMPTAAATPGPAGGVRPVGFFTPSAGCDSCDGYAMPGGCDGCGTACSDCGTCGGGCGCGLPLGRIIHGGLLGKLCHGEAGCADGCGPGYGTCGPGFGMGGACGPGGCGNGGNLSNMRFLCMWCRGSGCSACQLWQPGSLLAGLSQIRPYAEGGRCAQRWYDLSVEAIFLGFTDRVFGGPGGVITTQGIDGTPVLTGDSIGLGDLQSGVRLSGALMMGPGGNLEINAILGTDWSGSGSTELLAPGGPLGNLFYSFFSDFGTMPLGGFDDTDESLQQSVAGATQFDTFDVNYRRRVVGPYCRFQASWLAGFRYIRFDNALSFSAIGFDGTEFFDGDSDVDNELLGGQIGGDVWYHLMPGWNFGIGAKLGWVANSVEQDLTAAFNSAGPGATADTVSITRDDSETGTMFELDLATTFRLTHSWTLRGGYYLLAIEEVASGTLNTEFVQSAAAEVAGGGLAAAPDLDFDSVVLQGFTIGAEYAW